MNKKKGGEDGSPDGKKKAHDKEAPKALEECEQELYISTYNNGGKDTRDGKSMYVHLTRERNHAVIWNWTLDREVNLKPEIPNSDHDFEVIFANVWLNQGEEYRFRQNNTFTTN